ncbi:hypothetical protein IE53DRAFT_361215 [Violaceomyces palustris]|uniref:Uncharacterized protein n=1 Tax=Violaceomyces palustris TaxID=1673888 RepID=A0ACD0P1L5_9BASI|nr:hypothetical protein IE53DRAFT_361215 [Violaceomyces palustris]
MQAKTAEILISQSLISFNEYILEGSAIAHNENSELSKNFKLTMVEYRDEANKRKIMYVNPFSRKLLHLMKMNDEIRKLDARIIYELTDNNLDMWYNFSKNDKISYPFIDFSGIRRDGDNDSFDILKDGDKAIADFDDWMSNEASSSHS